MKKFLMPLLLVALMSSCTQSEVDAKRILTAEGCSQVELTGYQFAGCSDSDTYSTGFTAVRNGQKVTGVLCKGVFKGTTVRYF